MWLALPALAFAAPALDPGASPEEWIAAVDAPLASVAGLRWAVRRRTEQGATELDERWRFTWDGGDRFRVDYLGDTARQVASDGHVLVDYVPANARALRFELDALPAHERTTLLAQVLGRVFVPGLRIGGASALDWAEVGRDTIDGREALVLAGHEGGERRLAYTIDLERAVLLRSEAWHEGRTTLRTSASGHREVAEGLWLPSRVEVWTPESRVLLELSRVEALPEASPALFRLDLDPSVEVEAHR